LRSERETFPVLSHESIRGAGGRGAGSGGIPPHILNLWDQINVSDHFQAPSRLNCRERTADALVGPRRLSGRSAEKILALARNRNPDHPTRNVVTMSNFLDKI